MRSPCLLFALSLVATACAHDRDVALPQMEPVKSGAVGTAPTLSSVSAAEEVRDAPSPAVKDATALASGESSVNDATASEPAFVERAAVEALDRVAFLFHFQRSGREKRLVLSTDDLFAPGGDTLEPLTKTRLASLSTALKAQGPHPIRVRAYTDSLGDPRENQLLSERRANAIRDCLVSQGVRADRIFAEGKGASRPLATNETPEGRATNRRAEIIIE